MHMGGCTSIGIQTVAIHHGCREEYLHEFVVFESQHFCYEQKGSTVTSYYVIQKHEKIIDIEGSLHWVLQYSLVHNDGIPVDTNSSMPLDRILHGHSYFHSHLSSIK